MNADDGPGDSPGTRSQTQLRIGTWEETEEFVGTSFPTVRGADAVEAGAIRRRLEVLEWDCPLHCDTHGSGSDGGLIAPATMVGTSVAPWPVKGSTTATTPCCTMSLAQVWPPAGVDWFSQT